MKARGTWPGRAPAVPLTLDEPDEVRASLRASVRVDGDCWVWTGAQQARGYGSMRVLVGGVRVKALTHRLAYTVWRGPIPSGLTIDHLCANKSCINPEHLEAVSHKENIRRGPSVAAQNAVKTHCKRGHELAGDNVIAVAYGRHCRACQNLHDRRRREAIKAAAESLGLSWSEYVAEYGESRRAAHGVLAARTAVGR